MRESLRYLCHPGGPRASSLYKAAEGSLGSPREDKERAEFTAIDAKATRSTDVRSLPFVDQFSMWRSSTVVNCSSHSFGCSLRAAVWDAGWIRKAVKVSAMKATGPSAPKRSQRSQSAENHSASSIPPV